MKDAIYYNGTPAPLYELNAESYSVPVYLRSAGKKVFLKLRTPDFGALKKVLSNIKETDIQKVGDNASVREASGDEAIKEFVVNNFLAMGPVVTPSGQPADVDQQRAFVERNRGGVAALMGMAAVLNLSAVEPEEAADQEMLVIGDESDTQEVATEIMLAHYEKQEDVVVSVTHVLRQETEADRLAYKKLSKTRSRTENRQTITWNQTNYDSLSKLYDSMIVKLEGAVIDEKHCDEANKKEWAGKVPLSWKVFVLNQAFNRIEAKNA